MLLSRGRAGGAGNLGKIECGSERAMRDKGKGKTKFEEDLATFGQVHRALATQGDLP